MNGAQTPLTPAECPVPSGPDVDTPLDVAMALDHNRNRLTRTRSISIADFERVLIGEEALSKVSVAGAVVAGVVIEWRHEPSGNLIEMGGVYVALSDGTGVLNVFWNHGLTYEYVCDEFGERRHKGWPSDDRVRSASLVEDSDGYFLAPVRSASAPVLERGDLIAIRLDGFVSLDGEMWAETEPMSCSVLTPVEAGEDVDWHPRFTDPLPDEPLSVSALMRPNAGIVHEAAAPSLVTAADGLSLVAEGTSVLVSGLPDSGKSWFGAISMLDLMRAKPWGKVVWFDADGLGAEGVRGRFHALGCPPEWVQERVLIQPVPSRPHDEWVQFVSGVASRAMPIGAVWDGLNAALTATECGMDEAGVVKFRQQFMDPFRHARPACLVMCTDHIRKSANVRTERYSYGAQGKLAQHDQHLRIITSRDARVTRSTAGEMIVISQRNRSGHDDWDERTLTITPGHPFIWDHVGGSGLTLEERLATDLDRVLSVLRENGPLNTTEIRREVGLKNERVTAVLRHGLALGAITKERHGTANMYAIADAEADTGGCGEGS